MIELIATAGLVGGPLFAIGWHAKGPMQANIIKRLRKSNLELREELRGTLVNIVADKLRAERAVAESREKGRALSEALAERDEARRQLALAGKPDQKRDPKTGRWLPKAITSGDYTINNPNGKNTPDDGWIEWRGGEAPINEPCDHAVMLRDGRMTEADDNPANWRWNHNGGPTDIIAYRIADKPARKTVKVIGSGVEA